MSWVYEVDENRKHKRGWHEDRAGFVEVAGGILVGKCPRNLTLDLCRELLNTGVEYRSPRSRYTHPDRIYNIIDKVVYRATPTIPGKSYHGFPELQERAAELPRDLKDRILSLAEKQGCRQEVEKWMKG